MNAQTNRYNADGSENLNWWFGERQISSRKAEVVNTKPQYVRYTIESLKKRSTKRLNTMHYNTFGYITDRYEMIDNLFVKLNNQWNEYNEKLMSLVENMISTGKRGRPRKFEDFQVFRMMGDYILGGMKLVEVAEKYNTNIATVSQTINGKGTYSYLFDEDYYNDRIYDQISFS